MHAELRFSLFYVGKYTYAVTRRLLHYFEGESNGQFLELGCFQKGDSSVLYSFFPLICMSSKNPVFAYMYTIFCSVSSHLRSMAKISHSCSWSACWTEMLVCDTLTSDMTSWTCTRSQLMVSVQFVLHTFRHFWSQKVAARLYFYRAKCVCALHVLVQLLSSLNCFSLLLFRLIQQHRLCPARRLSGRSETHGNPL